MPDRLSKNMCRTRQEVIDSDPTLQDLCIIIDKYEKALAEGKNSTIHFELAQTRISLDTRIAQIQDREDIFIRFDDATTTITELNGKIDIHIKDWVDHPSLLKSMEQKHGKTLIKVIGLILSIYTLLFFTYHAIMYGTGFDIMFQEFLKNIAGL